MAMKVLLADDHPLMLSGVRRVLEEEPGGFEVVGESRTGSQVLPLIGRTNPDVVLLDMRMPGIDGLGCLERIKAAYPIHPEIFDRLYTTAGSPSSTMRSRLPIRTSTS